MEYLVLRLGESGLFLERGRDIGRSRRDAPTKGENSCVDTWVGKHIFWNVYHVIGDIVFFQNVANISFVALPVVLENEHSPHVLAYPFAVS